MSHFTVIFDACVLFSASMRDILLSLATTGFFRARWTEQIQDEWSKSLLAKRPDLDPERIQRIRDNMDKAFPAALVTGYEHHIPGLNLPDTDDHHVLAAAIHSGASAIVTFNTKHFPKNILQKYNIEAQHPDDFFVCIFDLNAGDVCKAIRKQRLRLKKPPVEAEEYLERLKSLGMAHTVELLKENIGAI